MLLKRFRLESRRQICAVIPWVTVSAALFVLLSIGGMSCQEPTRQEWAADGVIISGEYVDRVSYEDYEIHWDSDGQHVYIGIRAKTSGWVAVGFQPEPLHRETDMVLGFVEGGRASVFDMFSTAELGPCTADSELGGSDDVLEYAGREDDGYTVIEFKRLLSTGDDYDGELFSGENDIIWAYSSFDDPRQKHTDRGHGEIEL